MSCTTKRSPFAEPIPPVDSPVEEFVLDSSEQYLFDIWTQEHVGILGTSLEYWALDLAASTRDPLYDEPIQRAWKGPFKLKAWVEWAEDMPEGREEGIRIYWSGTIWIPRVSMEEVNCPPCSEGDVVRYWNTPFFQDDGSIGEPDPGRGWFFDVVEVDNDGHLFDTPNFVGFKCSITRRSEFTPERRLLNK